MDMCPQWKVANSHRNSNDVCENFVLQVGEFGHDAVAQIERFEIFFFCCKLFSKWASLFIVQLLEKLLLCYLLLHFVCQSGTSFRKRSHNMKVSRIVNILRYIKPTLILNELSTSFSWLYVFIWCLLVAVDRLWNSLVWSDLANISGFMRQCKYYC